MVQFPFLYDQNPASYDGFNFRMTMKSFQKLNKIIPEVGNIKHIVSGKKHKFLSTFFLIETSIIKTIHNN